MTHTRIKICGIRTLEAARAAVDAGVDAIGLVFVSASPRFVTEEQARQIVAVLPPMVEPIGLFVDAPADQVRQTAAAVGLRTVQLHGSELPAHIDQLAPLRVIKALPFDPQQADAAMRPWKNPPGNLAAMLWDAPPRAATDLTGGSGRAIDWHALAAMKNRCCDLPPDVLAGGLTPDNVADAIRVVRPYAVDVSSGVESSRGVKDAGLIRAFCEAVRQAGTAACDPIDGS